MSNSYSNQSLEREREAKYKHYHDNRPEYEIELTNKLAQTLSERNMSALSHEMMRKSASKSVKK
jgi:hypothetical protein